MLKHIRADVKFNFGDAATYSKEFHVALINEVIKAGIEHVNKSGIKIDATQVFPKDIGYSYDD